MCQTFGSNSEQLSVIIWFESSGVIVFNGETQKIESQISFFSTASVVFSKSDATQNVADSANF